MKKVLLFCFCLFSNNLFAENTVVLGLENVDGYLKVFIQNTLSEELLVNKRFAIGTSAGPSELVISFTDVNGKNYPFSAKVKLGAATENDLMLLEPNMFIGRVFELSRLANYYDLKSGSYSIKVTYKNRSDFNKGVYSNILESSTIVIKI